MRLVEGNLQRIPLVAGAPDFGGDHAPVHLLHRVVPEVDIRSPFGQPNQHAAAAPSEGNHEQEERSGGVSLSLAMGSLLAAVPFAAATLSYRWAGQFHWIDEIGMFTVGFALLASGFVFQSQVPTGGLKPFPDLSLPDIL